MISDSYQNLSELTLYTKTRGGVYPDIKVSIPTSNCEACLRQLRLFGWGGGGWLSRHYFQTFREAGSNINLFNPDCDHCGKSKSDEGALRVAALMRAATAWSHKGLNRFIIANILRIKYISYSFLINFYNN